MRRWTLMSQEERAEYNRVRRERYHSDPDYRAKRLERDLEVERIKQRHRYATDPVYRERQIERDAAYRARVKG